MSENEKYTYEVILEHLIVCEKRFSNIKTSTDFVNSDYGNILLDAIAVRLQAVGENLKRLLKHSSRLKENYPEIEWDNIILFRDFISHHYEKLDYEIIFDICENDVPQLIEILTQELDN